MKTFEEMNQIEKLIHNTNYMIESCKNAIDILKINNADYTPQSILQREVEKNEKWIKELQDLLKQGKTEL